MSCLYKRKNGVYYLRYKRDGKWVWRSLGETSKRAAEREAEKTLAGTRPEKPSRARDLTFEQLEKKYVAWAALHQRPKTIDSRKRALKLFSESCGRTRLMDVTVDDVELWKAARIAEQLKARTVNEGLGALQALVARARKQKWYVGPNVFAEVDSLPEPKKHPLWLSKDQIECVLEVAELHSREAHLFFALGLFAGLRKNEAINARWEWLDFKAGLMHVQRSDDFTLKDNEDRTIPLADKLREILEPYRAKKGYLIAPKKAVGKNVYRFEIRKTFDAVVEAAEVEWCTPHTLRHTFASQLVQAGVSLYKVATWLGHSNVRTTAIYAHLAPKDDDINKL